MDTTPPSSAAGSALSEAERRFLVEQGGVDPVVLTAEATEAALAERAEAREAAEAISWSDLSILDLFNFRGFESVVDAFPPEYLPVDIDHALTTPDEMWGGLSAADWLRAGGDVGAVRDFAWELNFL